MDIHFGRNNTIAVYSHVYSLRLGTCTCGATLTPVVFVIYEEHGVSTLKERNWLVGKRTASEIFF